MKTLNNPGSFLKRTHVLSLIFAICFFNLNASYAHWVDIKLSPGFQIISNSNVKPEVAFLVKAAEMHLEVMSLGSLAVENGKALHIKDLGKMIQRDHKKSLEELTALAKEKKIAIPNTFNEKTNAVYQNLSGITGKEFDRAYAELMVKRLQAEVRVFEKAVAESKDDEIKTWADSKLPVLRRHLDHAITSLELTAKM